MTEAYDAIVIGVGGFGSATVDHLAQRGAKVLGLEQFDIGHCRGSSHGETRVIRQAYFEHPDYVPLLKRAYTLWDELQDDYGQPLFTRCGLLMVGPPDGDCIAGAKQAANLHDIKIDKVDVRTARSRFSGFQVPDGFDILYEPNAGFLNVEDCVIAHAIRARRRGAIIRTDETVLDWESNGSTVSVRTSQNSYEASRLIITAGAWASQLLQKIGLPLTVLRKLMFWFPVKSEVYELANGGTTFFYETAKGCFYGFPSIDGQSVKLAEHTGGESLVDPLQLDCELKPTDLPAITDFVENHLPGLSPQPLRHVTCMYTMTPDEHFIVDHHSEHANVVFGAGFSGHGFKFTSAIGEALAQLSLDGQSKVPVEFLRLRRQSLK